QKQKEYNPHLAKIFLFRSFSHKKYCLGTLCLKTSKARPFDSYFNPLKNSTRLRRSSLERIWPMPSGIGDKPLSRVLRSLFFTVTRPSSDELMASPSAVSLLSTPA